jgi:hypothetical protein
MTLEERVNAVSEFGFSERQAAFLVTVMRHAGVCVPRQYARFAGTAYGQLVNAFFNKLVHDGFAIRCDCVHNRARVYHVHHRPLYRAIGEPDSRLRRPVPAARVMERLMLLDGVLEGASQEVTWHVSEAEKAAFFAAVLPSFLPERLPHATVGSGASQRVRLFPDALPIGVEPTGRVVLVYVGIRPVSDDFRGFVQRHGDLLRAVPEWTLRLVVPRHLPDVEGFYESAFREEFVPLSAGSLAELKWFFEQRKLGDERTRARSDPRFWEARHAFGRPRYGVLYRRWRSDGDAAFNIASATEITDALARGTGRVESVVLPFSYRHLAPLVDLDRSASSQVEEGHEDATRSQPPGGGAIASATGSTGHASHALEPTPFALASAT